MSRRRRFYRVKKETVKVDPKKVEIWNECSRDMELIFESLPYYSGEKLSFQETVLMQLVLRIRKNISKLNPNDKPDEFSDNIPF